MYEYNVDSAGYTNGEWFIAESHADWQHCGSILKVYELGN